MHGIANSANGGNVPQGAPGNKNQSPSSSFCRMPCSPSERAITTAPQLSLKGRTPASLLRLVSQVTGDPSCSWPASGLAGLVYEEPRASSRPPARWCVVELRDPWDLLTGPWAR